MNVKIVAVNKVGSHRTGSLSGELTVKDIENVLGFPANCDDDTDKVKFSWGFKADGVHCGIWDYKGFRWSTYGPREVFMELFGESNVR